jgi:hypothetical protein
VKPPSSLCGLGKFLLILKALYIKRDRLLSGETETFKTHTARCFPCFPHQSVDSSSSQVSVTKISGELSKVIERKLTVTFDCA